MLTYYVSKIIEKANRVFAIAPETRIEKTESVIKEPQSGLLTQERPEKGLVVGLNGKL